MFIHLSCSRSNFILYLFRCILNPPVWVKEKMVISENFETVKLHVWCVSVLFYGTMVIELKGNLVTVKVNVWVPTTLAQVPTDTGTCCSLKDHGGISKQFNSKTAQEGWFMAHVRNRGQRVPWHRHDIWKRVAWWHCLTNPEWELSVWNLQV